MRPIHTAKLDKTRPVLILTRELVRPHLTRVTVAPITSTVDGIATEVPVGPRNGLDTDSAIKCDQIVSIPIDQLHEQCGWLLDAQELELHEAIRAAFDLV